MLQVPTLFYTLVERPQQPHEKHGNTSLSQELRQELGLSSHGFGQIGVFTVRTTPPVHNVSYKLTHDSTPFSSELEKGGYIARKACASTSYFYNYLPITRGIRRGGFFAVALDAVVSALPRRLTPPLNLSGEGFIKHPSRRHSQCIDKQFFPKFRDAGQLLSFVFLKLPRVATDLANISVFNR